jgi:hypothetical protein
MVTLKAPVFLVMSETPLSLTVLPAMPLFSSRLFSLKTLSGVCICFLEHKRKKKA